MAECDTGGSSRAGPHEAHSDEALEQANGHGLYSLEEPLCKLKEAANPGTTGYYEVAESEADVGTVSLAIDRCCLTTTVI